MHFGSNAVLYTAQNNAPAIVLTVNYGFNMAMYTYIYIIYICVFEIEEQCHAAVLSSVDGGVMKTTSS